MSLVIYCRLQFRHAITQLLHTPNHSIVKDKVTIHKPGYYILDKFRPLSILFKESRWTEHYVRKNLWKDVPANTINI